MKHLLAVLAIPTCPGCGLSLEVSKGQDGRKPSLILKHPDNACEHRYKRMKVMGLGLREDSTDRAVAVRVRELESSNLDVNK